MIISKEIAELIKDDEGQVRMEGIGWIPFDKFPIETDDYLNKPEPTLTDNDQKTLVLLKAIQDNDIFTILFKQDNKDLMYLVIEIDYLIKKTLETFKD